MKRNKLVSKVYYRGRHKHLIGKRALIQECKSDPLKYLCQFDDTTLELNGVLLGFGWHEMLKSSFRYEVGL
jgi:hypothetical protein